MTAFLDDYRWLTEEARSWLALAAEELAAAAPLVRLTERLRKELSPERTHLVLEQVEVRRRARDKFTRAAEMFFTRQGLEQATDEALARYKAERFGGAATIADLCCGIGGDLAALGVSRPCVGVDRDPIAVHLATVNATVCGLPSVTVECRDVTTASLAPCDAWHIDPDRRPGGKRTVQAEHFDPPWEVVQRLRSRCADGAVKLAPATELTESEAAACERQWIESRGECRQQMAWFGSLARNAGKCAATVIDAAGGPATVVGMPSEPVPIAATIGPYVYEPCAAVLAARLSGALCQRRELAAVAAGIGYLTGQRRVDDPLLTGFEVLDVMPLDVRRLKQTLKQRQIGPLEVKKRGVDVDPQRLARELSRGEGENGVVIVAPIGGRTTAIVARRLVNARV